MTRSGVRLHRKAVGGWIARSYVSISEEQFCFENVSDVCFLLGFFKFHQERKLRSVSQKLSKIPIIPILFILLVARKNICVKNTEWNSLRDICLLLQISCYIFEYFLLFILPFLHLYLFKFSKVKSRLTNNYKDR